MKTISVKDMRSLEKEADSKGWRYSQMMDLAGRGVAEIINNRFYSRRDTTEVIGLVGGGNNGGDTLVALTALNQNGWKTTAYSIQIKSDLTSLLEAYISSGGTLLTELDDLVERVKKSDLILLDGLLGTGVALPLRKDAKAVLSAVSTAMEVSRREYIVVAVDCPSGVDCETGEASPECIHADLTICMAAIKLGLLKFPAFEYCGELLVAPIGLDSVLPDWSNKLAGVVSDAEVKELLPPRPVNSHKGTYGSVLVVGGSINYVGAPVLAAEAAYRVGTGLVQIASLHPVQNSMAARLPEATWMILPEDNGEMSADGAALLRQAGTIVDGLLFGPGLGSQIPHQRFVERWLLADASTPTGIGFNTKHLKQEKIPKQKYPGLVIDADGLRAVAGIPEWWKKIPENCILTPHPGEMAILTGLPVEIIQADREGCAKTYSQTWKQVVVLKGAITIIAEPDGRSVYVPIATSALAHAGTGDVLAGMIAGYIAQGLHPFAAAICGCWIHGQAALRAEESAGSSAAVLASDVINNIGKVLDRINKKHP